MHHSLATKLSTSVLVLGACLLLTAANCDKDHDGEESGQTQPDGGRPRISSRTRV